MGDWLVSKATASEGLSPPRNDKGDSQKFPMLYENLMSINIERRSAGRVYLASKQSYIVR